MKNRSSEDIVIIGAGPAGITCAIQLSRHGFHPVVLEKSMPGGLVRNAFRVENYPGFPDGVKGTEICRLLDRHMKKYGIEAIMKEVVSVNFERGLFTVDTGSARMHCHRLVVASGTRPVELQDVLIEEGAEQKIFREVYPLLGVKNKTIAITGGGDAAFDYSLSLAENNKVSVFNRTSGIRAIPALVDYVGRNENIKYYSGYSLMRVSSAGKVIELKFKDKIVKADYLIFAIGREPDSGFIKFSTSVREGLMNSGKLFFIGDVANRMARQMAVAAGDGIRCAMTINQLKEGV